MLDFSRLGPVIFRFSRAEIEAVDLSRFLWLFEPRGRGQGDHDGQGDGWRMLLSGVHVILDDGGEDPDGFLTDPVVRRFCRGLHARCPHLGYLCSLESPLFYAIGLCVPEDIQVVGRRRSRRYQVRLDGPAMRGFVEEVCRGTRAACRWAGWPESVADEREAALRHYFLSGETGRRDW